MLNYPEMQSAGDRMNITHDETGWNEHAGNEFNLDEEGRNSSLFASDKFYNETTI